MGEPIHSGDQEPNKPSDKGWKSSEKFEEAYQFAQHNIWDTVALVVLVIGIIFSLGKLFVGGLLIGIVAGIYFADAVVEGVKNLRVFVKEEGILRSLILGGLILGLFIATPGIFIGAVAAIGIKQLIKSSE